MKSQSLYLGSPYGLLQIIPEILGALFKKTALYPSHLARDKQLIYD